MDRGQMKKKGICPQFSQRLRGFAAVFFTGQMVTQKAQSFTDGYIYTLILLIYKYTIYICPICPIVNKPSKGGAFERDRLLFTICPNLSNCPEIT